MSGSCPLLAAPELPEKFSGEMALWLDEAGAIGAVRVASAARERGAMGRNLAGAVAENGILDLILVCDRPAFLKAVSDALHGGCEATVEFRLRAQEAAPFTWVEMRASRCSATGAVMGTLRHMSDRTTQKASSPSRTVHDGEAADWRQRLLANVSHELRTPLNAIIGFSEILASAELCPRDPEQQREYARIINGSGQHLLSVVNTILDMSKIESGVFSIEPEHFDLAALIDFSCDLVKLKAQEKSIELLAACTPDLSEIVADKRACKQILLNLLSNAVKFTPEGGRVTVVARRDGTFFEINVADTGIGVTSSELQRLGDPFYQARSTYDRPYEGAGLGLSIVRGLVGLHGGAISFASAPNEGASVTVRLPMDCRQADRADALSARIETLSRRDGAHKAPSLHPHHQVKKIA